MTGTSIGHQPAGVVGLTISTPPSAGTRSICHGPRCGTTASSPAAGTAAPLATSPGSRRSRSIPPSGSQPLTRLVSGRGPARRQPSSLGSWSRSSLRAPLLVTVSRSPSCHFVGQRPRYRGERERVGGQARGWLLGTDDVAARSAAVGLLDLGTRASRRSPSVFDQIAVVGTGSGARGAPVDHLLGPLGEAVGAARALEQRRGPGWLRPGPATASPS